MSFLKSTLALLGIVLVSILSAGCASVEGVDVRDVDEEIEDDANDGRRPTTLFSER